MHNELDMMLRSFNKGARGPVEAHIGIKGYSIFEWRTVRNAFLQDPSVVSSQGLACLSV